MAGATWTRRGTVLGVTTLALGLSSLVGVPAGVAAAAGEAPSAAKGLPFLQAAHPRLLLTDTGLQALRARISRSPAAQAMQQKLEARGRDLLTEPPLGATFHGEDGMLETSREGVQRIYTLALLYRLDGDRRFADRAIAELRAVAAFRDWNPAHFLDTAEMTHAVAIGYDWLYDVMSPDDREVLARAIVEKGLTPALAAYHSGAWWTYNNYNWNLVCGTGAITAALAVGDREPDLAREALKRAITSMPIALKPFGPDGGYPEGMGYWHYATRYLAVAIGSLETALGKDYHMSEAAGLARAGEFALHMRGPSGNFFDFSDCSPRRIKPLPVLEWLAQRYHLPALAYAEQQVAEQQPEPQDLLWFSEGDRSDLARMPLDAYFRGVETVAMRSSWTDPMGWYIGFKGNPAGNATLHRHLDGGSFVLDALGERWSADLGPEDYNVPGYFEPPKRWDYLRVGTLGHSTLAIGDQNKDSDTLRFQNQSPDAAIPIVAYHSDARQAFAIADLSAAEHVWSARRGIALLPGRRRVLVQDEVDSGVGPIYMQWSMVTPATIATDWGGGIARMTQGSHTLVARILSPIGATFHVAPIAASPPQKSTEGYSRLSILLEAPTARIAVVFSSADDKAPRPQVKPLAEWVRAAGDSASRSHLP